MLLPKKKKGKKKKFLYDTPSFPQFPLSSFTLSLLFGKSLVLLSYNLGISSFKALIFFFQVKTPHPVTSSLFLFLALLAVAQPPASITTECFGVSAPKTVGQLIINAVIYLKILCKLYSVLLFITPILISSDI